MQVVLPTYIYTLIFDFIIVKEQLEQTLTNYLLTSNDSHRSSMESKVSISSRVAGSF